MTDHPVEVELFGGAADGLRRTVQVSVYGFPPWVIEVDQGRYERELDTDRIPVRYYLRA